MWKICKRIFNLYLHGHHLFADPHLSDVWVLRFAQFSENIIRFFIIITINLFYTTFFLEITNRRNTDFKTNSEITKAPFPTKRDNYFISTMHNLQTAPTQVRWYILFRSSQVSLYRDCEIWFKVCYIWWTLIISRRSRISRRNNYCKGFWNNLRRYWITFPDAGILAEFSGKASLVKVSESKITLLIALHFFRSFTESLMFCRPEVRWKSGEALITETSETDYV